MNKLSNLIKDLKQKENPPKAKILMKFFKTGKGQYGERDLFLGLTVPETRELAKKYFNLNFSDIEKLLKNKYHEARLLALIILVNQYKSFSARKVLAEKISFAKATVDQRKIFDFYLKNTKYIKNWDLVDLSAHYIIGDYLYRTWPRPGLGQLEKLAKSKNLWERRIAIISTFAFIYKGKYEETFKITKMLLNDQEDLIHKACGWMLREVGKRVSEAKLRAFLDIYGPKMPRTMLRYAIERLPEIKRKYYLNR